MGKIALVRTALKSRVVRELVGERTVDFFAYLTTDEKDESGGGIISTVIKIGTKLVGFATSILFSVGRWLLRNLWDIILTVSFEIAYFDWAQTDEQIQRQMESSNVQIAAAAGELLGVGAIWLASIGLAGLATMKWPVIAGKVLLDLAEEGGDEIRAELRGFLTSVRNALARNIVMGTFLTARQLRLFGLRPIEREREPWTIAGQIEERVESIPSQVLQTFVENFLEGATDALIEVGYVVTYSIEDFYRSQAMANRGQLGPDRGVKITPDERKNDEFVIITGPQELAQQQVETVLNQHRFVHNRDLGQLVGMPARDYLRGGVQLRKLEMVFKSKQQPPWIAPPGEEAIKEVSYSIPEVEHGLTWNELKLAGRPWLWGRHYCNANLEGGRKMRVHGATADEAEEKLRELAALSRLNILTISTGEERERPNTLKKYSTRMYPAYATLLVRRPTYDQRGISDLSGQTYSQEEIRIDLWPDTEPPGVVAV